MYLKWNTTKLTDLTDNNVEKFYNLGYLFGRDGKGSMYQTRSVRIKLDDFSLSSENRRVLRKTKDVLTNVRTLVRTLPYQNYHWSIHKMGKDFYTTKFGDKTFSANKIKELMTNPDKSNFNKVFIFDVSSQIEQNDLNVSSRANEMSVAIPLQKDCSNKIGYCIALETKNMIHYCYPFYDLATAPKSMGMYMMLQAILYAKENNKKYIYLGSTTRPSDTYKLQFSGLEWFDEKSWSQDLDKLKNILKNEQN